jgi:hypothetical protein
MPWFTSRAFAFAGLPSAVRADLESERLLTVHERVPVRQRFSGSIPGRRDALGVSRHRGIVVCTGLRLYAAVPSMPRLTEPAIDVPWRADAHGPAHVTIDDAGLTLAIDLPHVDQRFHGELSMTFRIPLLEADLAVLPARSLSFAVTPAYVSHALGVRAK